MEIKHPLFNYILNWKISDKYFSIIITGHILHFLSIPNSIEML